MSVGVLSQNIFSRVNVDQGTLKQKVTTSQFVLVTSRRAVLWPAGSVRCSEEAARRKATGQQEASTNQNATSGPASAFPFYISTRVVDRYPQSEFLGTRDFQTRVYASEVNVLASLTWLTLGPASASCGAYFSLAKAKQGKGKKLVALTYQQAVIDHEPQYRCQDLLYCPVSDSGLFWLYVKDVTLYVCILASYLLTVSSSITNLSSSHG